MKENKLNKIFGKKNDIVIGMIHFPPLLGYKDFPGINVCLKKSLQDAKILEQGGVDGLMVENNYDIPHKTFVEHETVEIMIALTKAIIEAVSIPVGVNVLWNDYKAAFSIAKECGCKFIRVPVFIDSIRTQYGKILAKPEKVLSFRARIDAPEVALFTDIHVKHAEMIEGKTITQSAKEAIENDSDGIIITGKWTGDIPDINELKKTREVVGKNFPILVGSGATKANVDLLLKYADGIIVGTSLKTGETQAKDKEVNLKPWQEKISLEKTKEFILKIQD